MGEEQASRRGCRPQCERKAPARALNELRDTFLPFCGRATAGRRRRPDRAPDPTGSTATRASFRLLQRRGPAARQRAWSGSVKFGATSPTATADTRTAARAATVRRGAGARSATGAREERTADMPCVGRREKKRRGSAPAGGCRARHVGRGRAAFQRVTPPTTCLYRCCAKLRSPPPSLPHPAYACLYCYAASPGPAAAAAPGVQKHKHALNRPAKTRRAVRPGGRRRRLTR